MMKKKRIAIIGSTGSVGVNTLRVIRANPGRFEVVALSALNSVRKLEGQIREFRPKYAALAGAHALRLKRVYPAVKFFDAACDLSALVTQEDIDLVVIAVTGASGLEPFLAAVRAGKTVAPANKEALVMAGDLLMSQARKYRATVIPVDSEQSAIFQCLQGQNVKDVHSLHLTASGGALRDVPAPEHGAMSVQRILTHPRWKMGAKITVDSATLMNKGFEVIEAQRLFGIDVQRINVVVHPEAVVHSMVEFVDGSVMAQMGVTDMRLPIQYALDHPHRFPTVMPRLDLVRQGALTFERPDLRTFPSLRLAYDICRQGGVAPAVLNAADEVAVAAFLDGKISFTRIYAVVERTCRAHFGHTGSKGVSLADIRQADAWARQFATAEVERKK